MNGRKILGKVSYHFSWVSELVQGWVGRVEMKWLPKPYLTALLLLLHLICFTVHVVFLCTQMTEMATAGTV